MKPVTVHIRTSLAVEVLFLWLWQPFFQANSLPILPRCPPDLSLRSRNASPTLSSFLRISFLCLASSNSPNTCKTHLHATGFVILCQKPALPSPLLSSFRLSCSSDTGKCTGAALSPPILGVTDAPIFCPACSLEIPHHSRHDCHPRLLLNCPLLPFFPPGYFCSLKTRTMRIF